ALRAGYGTGDGCSSYGNRNLYNYFTDWFGSTQTTGPIIKPPVLTDINSTSYVVATDGKGNLYGYPYTKSTWGNSVKLASGLGALSNVFSVGDLDGDGRRDFIVVNSAGKPSVLKGGAKTALGKPVALAGNWAGVKSVLPAGDFNRDGLEDLFTTDDKGILFLRAGNGFGGFSAAVSIGGGWSSMTQVMSGHDFDGDGNSDLVARDPAGNLKLFPGNGKSGWGATVQIGNGWNPMTSIFTPGDFTGDGNVDILAHTANGVLYLYKGSKGGKLTNGGDVGTSWQAFTAKGSAGLKVKPLPMLQSGIGNADSAGGVDVVAADGTGTAYLYGGNGSGGWSGKTKIGSGWKSTDKIVHLGDFDQSGSADFARIDSSGRFIMHSNVTGKTVQIGTGWGPFTQVFGGLDFDGDRKTDVIAILKNGDMYLYRGNGKGGWISTTGQQIGGGWSGVSNVFYAGDFNGDGKGDVIARFGDALRLYPLTGRSNWGKTQQIGQGWSSFPTVFSPGDFNGDGHTDVMTIKSNGSLYLYPSNGKGSWGTPKQIGQEWNKMSPIG
ncbi:MAG: FG-GAP repeat domain-containing protein, partial [Microbacterium sp.]|uniref:FG-GAP repeat domain-containing protein n=1 Tax=Microbacterium sp. TaxID=51671 RepID=UPI003F9947C5